MTHRTVTAAVESLGMKVRQEPATGRRAYSAAFDAPGSPRVYWTTSQSTENLLGRPRVTHYGHDTHARTVAEIQYLVRRDQP